MNVEYVNGLGETCQSVVLAEFTYHGPDGPVQMLVVYDRVGKPAMIRRDEAEFLG